MFFRTLALGILMLQSTTVTSYAEEYDWNRFYIGGFVGNDSGKVEGHSTNSGSETKMDIDGSSFGITVGKNYKVNQFLFGVEGDYTHSRSRGNISCTASQTCTNQVNWLATLRGRAGIIQGKTLFFATGGLAVLNGTSKTTPKTAGTTGKDTQRFTGWTAGFGAEHAVNNLVSIKAEYLYSDLGSRTSPAGTVGQAGFVGEPTLNTVKLGFNVAF